MVSKQRENSRAGKPEDSSLYRRRGYWFGCYKRRIGDAVKRNPQIHGAILKFKIIISQVAKLVSPAASMCKETTHRMAQKYVLFRRTKE